MGNSLQQLIGKRSDFDSKQQEASLSLQMAASVMAAGFSDLFKAHGISDAAYNVLRIVAGHGHMGIPSQKIGPMMVRRLPDITRLVDRLVDKGLVKRARCDQDKRVTYVCITAAGSALLRKLNPKVQQLHETQLSGLSEVELQRLSKLLMKVIQSIRAE